MPETTWFKAVAHLRARREAGVLVTVASVRGHAPRDAGAKLVVGARETWGSIGGGNVEAVAIDRARELLADPGGAPVLFETALSDKAPYEHGVQCCGGTVTVLLEPLPVVPAVAIFGVGHVGFELARILARHDIELHLVDTRPEQLTDERLAPLSDAVANVHVHRVPMLPEIVLGELPPGTHLLIMTHVRRRPPRWRPRFDRADRLGGEMGSVPADAGRGRPRHVVDRPDPHAHRPGRDHRQGAGDDRRERRGRPPAGVRARAVRGGRQRHGAGLIA
jgi:hypothetical protein